MTGKTFVLIHGGFHGGWCWKAVARRLRALGHEVHTPSHTGMGERAHLAAGAMGMATFEEDLLRLFHYEDITDAVVVGHSFGGSAVSILADRLPDRVRHLVYLDAMVLQDGQSPLDTAPPGRIEQYRANAVDTANGKVIPPADPAAFGIADPQMAEWVRARLTPQPLQTFLDPIHLAHPLGNGLPATYIACTQPWWSGTGSSRDLARKMPGWDWVELPCGHDAMLLLPDELSDILAAI
ncbi:alpha/beta fold hydrolase [Antarctobacter sp.]|uniref:alpha/beta fold hydrolase n=1 Tax=Antarctobacter sp. TaxID=1872577 RepID=UPI003A8F2EA0